MPNYWQYMKGCSSAFIVCQWSFLNGIVMISNIYFSLNFFFQIWDLLFLTLSNSFKKNHTGATQYAINWFNTIKWHDCQNPKGNLTRKGHIFCCQIIGAFWIIFVYISNSLGLCSCRWSPERSWSGKSNGITVRIWNSRRFSVRPKWRKRLLVK